ncbi:MocR-like pyridoxine biosynthesis transcription factor PdxR [Ruegeria aquimaris]|uniref:PLP-dependent aminotransferase family protein n=1 Tax=Ruegeria aquimaris TaxID=2984333 RepID=A0ABT3AJ43_9RHOB|nr:PLP-dependent aminotransferase family protein [Ruegeria sp. XHP0148]MCV2888720.1 PLP-dependent aminotransferase family protein [Ruegeria sp. XHP0148]
MPQTSWPAISIDRQNPLPIFEQICAAIRSRAGSGQLPAGSQMPPTRALATELGVSRSTVVTAYDQLVAEGYLKARQGSGYLVCAMGEVELSARPSAPPVSTLQTSADPRPFVAGTPDMRLFPYRQWAKTVARLCRSNPQAMFSAGDRFGNPALRNAIAAHLRDWRGIDAGPHQVIVTAGATDGLELCMRTLAEPGDCIALESPGYPPLAAFAAAQGLRSVLLPVGVEGAALPDPDANARLAILTPSHQYPLGGAMSPNRRRAFVNWAHASGGWIVEDDYDSEFRYAGRPIPAMAGGDRLGCTIYVGSFSKIFSNALRLGYLVVPETLIDPFRATLRRFGLHASSMPQQVLAEFMTSGEFYRHLRRVRRIYAERRRYLFDRLAREFEPYGHAVDHQAGMQAVLHLRESCRDTEIATRAAQAGLTVEALSRYSTGKPETNGLVLGFCAFTEIEMAPALTTLRDLLAAACPR